jgi:hypothetical protein
LETKNIAFPDVSDDFRAVSSRGANPFRSDHCPRDGPIKNHADANAFNSWLCQNPLNDNAVAGYLKTACSLVYYPPATPEAMVFAGDGQRIARWHRLLERAKAPPTMIV